MRTTKGTWRMGMWGVIAGAVLMMMAPVANAQTATTICSNSDTCRVASDRAASILVYPKIVVDTSNGTDTVIQLTHTGDRRTVDVHCFWVNANGHCSVDPNGTTGPICQSDLDCNPSINELCRPGWLPNNFNLRLTKRQPVSWKASEGTLFLPCDANNPAGPPNCATDDQSPPQPIFNIGSVPNVAEDPFIGELKCIQVDEADNPVDFNDLKGEATIVRTAVVDAGVSRVDVEKYNAVGIQAIPSQNNGDRTLCLGSGNDECPTPEYAGCPHVLAMTHFFDGAVEPIYSSTVTSDLTLVPCSQDLVTGQNNINAVTAIQFLIFNEFEQRTSTSFRISCFVERQLADIDTRVGTSDNDSSIFSASVQGTLTGQSRIRPVSVGDQARGYIGLLEEFHSCSNGPEGKCSASVNLHQQGLRNLPDTIKY